MRKDCKDNLIAEAHKNPEYAAMSAKKLATFIDADQSTISIWRRKVREMAAGWNYHGKNAVKLNEEALLVRKNWEKKYADLSRQYDYISDRLFDMAKKADMHRNHENELKSDLFTLQSKFDDALKSIEIYRNQLAQEKKSWFSRLFS